MVVHALPVDVYRFRYGDCSNNGISNRFSELLIACPDGQRSFDPSVEIPLNFCMVSWYMGNARIVPACVSDDGRIVERPGWFMYGGNIADASDSRWYDLTGVRYPLHIHDRKEW